MNNELTKAEISQLLLRSQPIARSSNSGFDTEELDFWTDKNLSLEERRYNYLNKEFQYNSDSDGCFSEYNVLSIIMIVGCWISLASILGLITFTADTSFGDKLTIWVASIVASAIHIWVTIPLLTHPMQPVNIDISKLQVYLSTIALITLLCYVTTIPWALGLLLSLLLVRKLCFPKNYYKRVRVYL